MKTVVSLFFTYALFKILTTLLKHRLQLCPPSWKNDLNNVVGTNVVSIDDIRDQRHK